MSKTLKLKWIVIANFLNNAGAALMWPLTTVYMHNYLHQSLSTAGIVLLFMSSAMVAGNYLGGWLFDHWDPYKTAVVSVTIAMVAVFLLIFFNDWPVFAVLLTVVGFGDGANITVVNAYAASVKRKSSRFVFNILYMALNVGVVVGTLAVGILLPMGIQIVFGVTTFFYVLFFLVTVFKFKVPIERRTTKPENKRQGTGNLQISKLVWLICVLVTTSYLSYALWESVMAVHLTNMHIPFYAYSMLWTINGILIIIGQPFVNMLAPYLKLRRQIEIGVVIFAASFIMLIFIDSFWGFIIDFVVLTIGEMLGLPGIPAWVDELTNQSDTGKYQGMVNIAISVGRALGPLYGGLIIDHLGYPSLFLSVGILMILSLGLFLNQVRRMKKTT